MRSTNIGVVGACAVVLTFSAACDDGVTDNGASSESTVCNTVGTSWWNQSFADQAGTFHVEFAATPSRNNIDAVVGLSNGSATAWSKLAAIVRFNPDGFIDARNGSTYTAVQNWPYSAGATYYIRIDVDVQHHTYSAWAATAQGQYGSWNQVANNYAFRSEQASVTKLNNLSGFVNTTTPGSLQVCGFILNATQATDCVASNAGGGFVNVATVPGVNGMIVDFAATPSQTTMDGVVGVSLGAADDYNDFAAAVRFYTNGRVEARDGDTYRADTVVTYAAGEDFDVRLVIDISNKTYSVFLFVQGNPDYAPPVELAKGYRFRTQQLGVTRLDHAATVVASPTGHVDMCGARNLAPANLRYVREGRPAMAVTSDGVVVSDGATAQRLDANGKVVASTSVGGVPAVDASGNIYLARVVNTTMTVDAFTPTFARRWTKSIEFGTTSSLTAAIAGTRLLVAGRQADGTYVRSFSTADGSTAFLNALGGVVAVGAGGYAAVSPQWNGDGSVAGYTIDAYTPDGTSRFEHTFGGNFTVSAVAVAPNGGAIFGGYFNSQTMNFGDKTLYSTGNSEEGPFNSYYVVLTPTGALDHSEQTDASNVQDIDTTGSAFGISHYQYTQFPWVDFSATDTRGHGFGCAECDVGLGHQGYSREIAVTTGRAYLNVDEHLWWEGNRVTFPFMLAYDF